MGYELVIRPRTTGQNLPIRTLIGRLDAAAASGIHAPAEAPPAPAIEAADPAAMLASAAQAAPPKDGAPPAAMPSAAEEPDWSKAGPWTIANGGARFLVRLFRSEGEARGVDLDVPFGGSEEELRRVVEFATLTADSIGGLVFDPQLGREVGKGSADDVVARWRQSQAWAADFTGMVDDPRGLVEIKPPPPLLSGRAKAVLVILGLFVLLYWLLDGLMSVMTDL